MTTNRPLPPKPETVLVEFVLICDVAVGDPEFPCEQTFRQKKLTVSNLSFLRLLSVRDPRS